MIRVHLAVRWAARLLLGGGVLALAYAAYIVLDAHAYQAIHQRPFEPAPSARLSAPTVMFMPADGDAIGEIDIPRLGIAVVVAQGDSPAILQRAVGHVADTALPGQAGNVVLAGHRDTFFQPLKQVRAGDAITVKTLNGDFVYVVESTRVVPPTDLQVLEATGGRTLTLITCFPFSYIGSAPDRFIVRAREAGTP